jgi:hypothetical protein
MSPIKDFTPFLDWFAWHPVKVNDLGLFGGRPKKWVWLKTVKRRVVVLENGGTLWDYQQF